jgi:hypothetical protein
VSLPLAAAERAGAKKPAVVVAEVWGNGEDKK